MVRLDLKTRMLAIFFIPVILQDARLQELDDEHDLLQNGLQVIEKARKWYFKRITAIQEEKLHLQNDDQYSLEQVIHYVITMFHNKFDQAPVSENILKMHMH